MMEYCTHMIRKHCPRLAHGLTVPILALASLALTLAGCGESSPPEKPKTSAPAAQALPQPKTDAKGKKTDPTSLMERDEIRAYRKQQREQGKTP